MEPIRFSSAEHEAFYHDMLNRCENQDCYHQAFFYCMGITAETRQNINTLFDSKNDCIRLIGLRQGWQTGGSIRLCRLAMNLWNGYVEKGKEKMCTPYTLFDCSLAPYFMQAVQLRYAEYLRDDKTLAKAWERFER